MAKEENEICCDDKEKWHDPLSNTGRATPKNNFSTCIDYFKIRVAGAFFNDDDFVINLFKLLYLDRRNFDSSPGKGGYKIFLEFDEETFLMSGNEKSKLKDGNDCYFIELKGQGCRMLEQRFLLNNVEAYRGWYELFEYLFKVNESGAREIKIKRIDATLDDFTGEITQEELEEKYLKHHWTSRSRSFKLEKSVEFENLKNHIKYSKNDGWSLTHGGKTSRQLCIYNKKAERKARGYDAFVDKWLRYESRFLDENGDWAFLKLLNGLKVNNFSKVVCSLIGGIIEFKEDNDSDIAHMCRVPIWSKWDKLLQNAGSIKYVAQEKVEEDITMNKKKIWLVTSPYKLLCMAFMSDPDNFSLFLSYMMKKALKRMKKLDYKRVNYHRHEIGLEMMQVHELDKIVKEYFDLENAEFGRLPLYMQKYFAIGYADEDEEKFEKAKDKLLREEFNFDELVNDIHKVERKLRI